MSTEAIEKLIRQAGADRGTSGRWLVQDDELLTFSEALIKAALDAASEVCKDHFYAVTCPEAIRQITPQQVMERMK